MEHLADLLEWKNLTITKVYGARPYTMEMLKEWVDDACEKIKPFVCDTGAFLLNAKKEDKNILFEAQLGSLRDLDYGIHPYTTSSNTMAAYAPIGSGFPAAKIEDVVGVVKAYSTCVGEGPFVCEMFGDEAEELRKAGFEYGAKTGRPRRVGPLDIVATRYGIEVQAATEIALTKLDVLSYMDKIPVCTQYELDGQKIDRFPFPVALNSCKPVVEYFEGWKTDISILTQKLRTYDLKKIILDLGGNICAWSASSEVSIGIVSPRNTAELCCTYTLDPGEATCVITSGAYERFFEQDGVKYGHIMDTKTGVPANTDILSATVIGPDGTKGDVFSTALFSVGSGEAKTIAMREHVDCILCMENGTLWVSSSLQGKVHAQEGWTIEYFG